MDRVAEVERALDRLEPAKKRTRFQYQFYSGGRNHLLGIDSKTGSTGWHWYDQSTMKTKVYTDFVDITIGIIFFKIQLNWRFEKVERV